MSDLNVEGTVKAMNRAAKGIYLACDKMVADDISNKFLTGVEVIKQLQAQLAESEKLRYETIDAWSDMLDKAQAKIDKLEKQKSR